MTTARLVHDNPPALDLAVVLPEKCLHRLDDRHLCFLPRRHTGAHLPLPSRWAQRDISPSNPRYVPTQRMGGGR